MLFAVAIVAFRVTPKKRGISSSFMFASQFPSDAANVSPDMVVYIPANQADPNASSRTTLFDSGRIQ
jgi:hypothetical protein